MKHLKCFLTLNKKNSNLILMIKDSIMWKQFLYNLHDEAVVYIWNNYHLKILQVNKLIKVKF